MSSACPSPNRISYLWRNLNVEHLSSCTFLRCSLLALSSGRGNRLFKLWAVPTGPWCFKHLPQNSWNDTIEWELTYCSVWLFFRYSLFQPCAFRLCCLYSLQEDVIENVHSTHQRMDWGGGGASVHDQTSVSHWSPLWHFRLGVVAIEEGGGGGEWM